jgi:hypothetical protein
MSEQFQSVLESEVLVSSACDVLLAVQLEMHML